MPPDARRFAEAGVDGVQLDKVPASELVTLVSEIRDIDPHVTIIAAGGVNLDNASEYAATASTASRRPACTLPSRST